MTEQEPQSASPGPHTSEATRRAMLSASHHY